MLEVEKVRPVTTRFHVMSLSVLNEGRDLNPDYRKLMDAAWLPARACTAVAEEYGPDTLRDFYTALGEKFHRENKDKSADTVREALADLGLDEEIVDRAQTDELDDAMRASHHQGMDPVGDEVGTPVIHINGMALFGPIITHVPTGEEAGDLFDGFVKVTAYPHFYELKRSRRGEEPAIS